MSERLARIRRIAELRQRELDTAVAQLAEARAGETLALSRAEEAAQAARQSEERRTQLVASGADAHTFLEAEEWMAAAALRERRAWLFYLSAQRRTQEAQAHVLVAQNKLRQVEILAERIARNERLVEARAERRREDEIAARLARRSVMGS